MADFLYPLSGSCRFFHELRQWVSLALFFLVCYNVKKFAEGSRMLRIAIVEDDRNYIQQLQRYLQ